MTGMVAPRIVRTTSHGVALLGDPTRPSGVTLAFSEREGGVSKGPYESLNLYDGCGDDPAAVRENRRRVLRAMGIESEAGRLVVPRQVHGDDLVLITDGVAELERVRAKACEGADIIVCTAADVPVLFCFADCVPVILVAEGGFAIAHSGWRGTLARVAAKALRGLCEATGQAPESVNAYIGPHVAGLDYQVSQELCERFVRDFGEGALVFPNRVSLGACVRATLEEAGVAGSRIAACEDSTVTNQDRFFSYRGSGGTCGRHGAIACLTGEARQPREGQPNG